MIPPDVENFDSPHSHPLPQGERESLKSKHCRSIPPEAGLLDLHSLLVIGS